jgi:hypothetical protein
MKLIVSGDISAKDLASAISQYFPEKSVRTENFEEEVTAPNQIVIANRNKGREEKLLEALGKKEKEAKDLESSLNKSLATIQTFHQQQQALFDEFVLLRQKYDDMKSNLLTILWIHCGQFHPDLRLIPHIEDEATFVETDAKIGNFVVGDFLGEGQFATVRSCWHADEYLANKETSVEYSMKHIKNEKITTFQSLKRVSNEIAILRKLSNKHIINIYDVIHTTDLLYIVTEKGGADMFEFFDEHPDGVPEKWARDIMVCVLRAVHYCHEQGICHRGTQ